MIILYIGYRVNKKKTKKTKNIQNLLFYKSLLLPKKIKEYLPKFPLFTNKKKIEELSNPVLN